LASHGPIGKATEIGVQPKAVRGKHTNIYKKYIDAVRLRRPEYGKFGPRMAGRPSPLEREGIRRYMNFLVGIGLLLVGVGMVAIGRPGGGGQYVLPLMDTWVVGQLYVLTVLVAFAVGISFCLMAWPA
jgi:hypothetical protein